MAIESFAAAGEAATKIGDVVKDATERIGGNIDSYNPDKRIDLEKNDVNLTNDEKYDPDIRIDSDTNKEKTREDKIVRNEMIEKVFDDYIEDLKNKSDYPETISNTKTDVSKLEVQSPETVKKLREEFDDKKDSIRKQWEIQNNREWPTYKEDVYGPGGNVIRRAGDKYDAHHEIPLKLGGNNDVSNITPLSVNKHKEIHSQNGSCTKLVDTVKESKK